MLVSHSLQTDEELIAAACIHGDRPSLDALIRRHLPQVRRAVFQMVLDDTAADDVTQEVFMRAIRGLKGFDRRAKFSTWLFRISMNAARTHLEKASRVRIADHREAFDALPDKSPGPEGRLSIVELNDDIEQALAELPPSLRASLVLTTLESLSPTEAAEIEGCSTSTMYWRIHEARKKLRHRLREHLS